MCMIRCMSRTNIDIDDALIAEAMERFGVDTKKEAVDLALRRLVASETASDLVREVFGIGWEGDLDAMREGNRVEEW